MDILQTWEKIQPQLKDKVGTTSYETWFSSIQISVKDPQTLLIETPDEFFKTWIKDHYQRIIEELINQQAGANFQIELGVNSHMLKTETQNALTQLQQNFDQPQQQTNLNARFTFDNFVIGSSNRFACAASLAVAESPAKSYNPLFIYGPVGLGKTHLMQAITHKLQETYPGLKHYYMSSEQFTNELIDAIRHRSTPEFRKRYRHIDVLLIDDIQFIAGKESTQEEFFHTFNYLHDKRKQIIITSDRPPKDISNLEERLRSRFAWGLITDIQPPDFETRVAILRKKMEHETVKVPDDVILFIAEQIQTNIRELEGALIRVAAYALLEEKQISLALAKLILKDMVKETAKNISINVLQKTVADYFDISVADMKANRRTRNLVRPRQIAMYLARELTKMSLPEIGSAFGGKDHTTVLHSCKKIEEEMKKDAGMQQSVRELITGLKQ